MPAGQLWPVVTANRLRLPPFGNDSLQHPRHSSTRKARVHFQRQNGSEHHW
jgi:hypothetical protein